MNKMTLLRKELMAYILTLHSRTYFSIAPDDAQMPYVVLNIPFGKDSFNREDFVLEIDIWDDADDTSVIENLTDLLDGNGDVFSPTGLHRKMIMANTILAKIYRESRLSVEDNDKSIKRRRLRYTIEAYYKEV